MCRYLQIAHLMSEREIIFTNITNCDAFSKSKTKKFNIDADTERKLFEFVQDWLDS